MKWRQQLNEVRPPVLRLKRVVNFLLSIINSNADGDGLLVDFWRAWLDLGIAVAANGRVLGHLLPVGDRRSPSAKLHCRSPLREDVLPEDRIMKMPVAEAQLLPQDETAPEVPRNTERHDQSNCHN